MRGEDTYQWLKILDSNPRIKQSQIDFYVYRLHGRNTVYSDQFKKQDEVYKDALKSLKPRLHDEYVLKSIDRRISL